MKARESLGGVNAWYSLGLNVSSKGMLGDVLLYSPAYEAGLGPGMKIIAVNGRGYSEWLAGRTSFIRERLCQNT